MSWKKNPGCVRKDNGATNPWGQRKCVTGGGNNYCKFQYGVKCYAGFWCECPVKLGGHRSWTCCISGAKDSVTETPVDWSCDDYKPSNQSFNRCGQDGIGRKTECTSRGDWWGCALSRRRDTTESENASAMVAQ